MGPRIDLVAKLEEKGWSSVDWAYNSGVSRETTRRVMLGYLPERRVLKALADSLGVDTTFIRPSTHSIPGVR
jgi:lambda repressor-like predicted transcriptional regulator